MAAAGAAVIVLCSWPRGYGMGGEGQGGFLEVRDFAHGSGHRRPPAKPGQDV